MPTATHATLRHESSRGEWEMVVAAPPSILGDYVREYVGWTEYTTSPLCRRELPTEEVPLIFNFGAPTRVFDAGKTDASSDLRSFITGAYDTFVLIESCGRSAGLQINLTLLGARVLAGRPIGDLTNRAVGIEEVFGRDAALVESELYDAEGWPARFAIADRVLIDRLLSAPAVPPLVSWVWRRLIQSRGRMPIQAIVDESGRSHRHLVSQFTAQLGLAPKTLARVLRFSRAVGSIKAGRTRTLTDLAHACGYYDQAHFVRDCRAFAGVTPGELVRSLLPDRGGFLVEGSDLSKPPGDALATLP